VRLHDLLDGLDVPELRPAGHGGARDVDVQSVVHDNRDVEPGALFCCIPGSTTDGHAFAAAAADAGAVALLVERWVDVDLPQARVASVRAVLGPLSARFHGDPSRALRVLGVTGTNGKTTTAYLLESIARSAGARTGVVGTITARIDDRPITLRHTTPEATELQALLARMRDDGVGTVAMEVSSHALEQHRVDATHFAAVCFTNLSHDHLDYHGTIEAYFEAKARLFTPGFTARAAINIDDSSGRSLVARATDAGLEVRTYAVDDPGADVTAEGIRHESGGTAFNLTGLDGTRVPVHTSLVGVFNVANTLAAATTARLSGFDLDDVIAGLAAPIVVPGRMERVDAGQDFVVLVDYAHTPDALRTVLVASRALTAPGGRLLAVFGCGGDRDRTKRPIMGSIASELADIVVVTSDNPRSENPAAIVDEILEGISSGAAPPLVELDRRQAIREAVTRARSGDVVVVAGKGHESGQTARGVTRPFDDRVVAREELEALACPR
jgi:UDP-N-acetylmuramoyl-L-alanyl-D-glutamate--2,6-diaminopimelate ligase